MQLISCTSIVLLLFSLYLSPLLYSFLFFFFNDTATTEIYTLSLHDALPILRNDLPPTDHRSRACATQHPIVRSVSEQAGADRKSTRLNSSHLVISYAVFCLKKKKTDTPSQEGMERTSSTACVRTSSPHRVRP